MFCLKLIKNQDVVMQISKYLFNIFNSPKKQTKNPALLLWYLKSNCFRLFFGRIETPKRHFEIN